MSFYENKILPHIINSVCSSAAVMKLREKVVPLAFGDVLEVGIGSAINLALYHPEQVNKIWGLEPSLGMREKARKNLARSTITVEWLSLAGEDIPLPDHSVDCVLMTFTLCTIPNWRAAMAQIHRVLKPEGKLLFCEHGLAPDASVEKWQNRLNGPWSKLSGGCNLNRPTLENITTSGFLIDWSESGYMPNSPKLASYVSYGVAHKTTAKV